MHEEKIIFKSKSRTKLIGKFLHPKMSSEKAVIICHGFTGNMEEPLIRKFAKHLSQNGYGAFRFDFFGQGKSGGRFVDLTLLEEKENLEAAIKVVSRKYKKIGLVGHSLGGLIISMLANRSRSLVFWAPALLVREIDYYIFGKEKMKEIEEKGFIKLRVKDWGHDYRNSKKPFLFGKKLWEEIKYLDEIKNVKRITVPVRFIQAGKDGVVATRFNKKAYRYIKSKKDFKTISRANHIFRGYHEKVFKLTLEWFKENL